MSGFDRTTVVTAVDAGRFTLELDGSWSSLRGIHGGYLAALSARVAQQVRPDRPVRTLTTSFLRPARPGPAEAVVELHRAGRSVSTVGVTIAQRTGAPICVTRLTMMDPVVGEAWDHDAGPDMAPLAASVALAPPPGIGHFDQAVGVLDPERIPFSDGPTAGIAGRVRPLEPGVLDEAWLAMVMDWFPPSPFTRTRPPLGGVSIDFTVHLHRPRVVVGDDEWLAARFECDISEGGLALERGKLWGPDDTLLAESFHTRWTA